jgi:integrase
VLAWAERTSLPVARLADPLVLRRALDAPTLRMDGSRAAANTITRKRAVFHGALGYAVETGLLDSNPADHVSWQVPKAATAIDARVVASPRQAEALLAAVARIRPDLAAFFGCLYYGALRPEEAIALRFADCRLPAHGWGTLTLTRAAPRTSAAWTDTGTSHEQRGLKNRPTDRSGPSPYHRSWSPCSAIMFAATAPRLMADCSAVLAAACSAKAATAAPGTLLAPRPLGRWQPLPLSPAAPTTCGTLPCPCG